MCVRAAVRASRAAGARSTCGDGNRGHSASVEMRSQDPYSLAKRYVPNLPIHGDSLKAEERLTRAIDLCRSCKTASECHRNVYIGIKMTLPLPARRLAGHPGRVITRGEEGGRVTRRHTDVLTDTLRLRVAGRTHACHHNPHHRGNNRVLLGTILLSQMLQLDPAAHQLGAAGRSP